MLKRFLSISLAALILCGITLAQAAPDAQRGKFARRGGARMFQGLNLSEDQRTRVQSILQNERSQIQAIRGNSALTDAQKKEQVQALRKAGHQQVLSVLTPEQQAQLKQKHQGKMGRRAAFQRGRAFQALNLTAQQKEQLKPVFESTRQQMQALRADTSLTPEQKREKMQQIRQDQMTQMKSILTPEQQQQMQQMRGRRFHRGGEKPAVPNGF